MYKIVFQEKRKIVKKSIQTNLKVIPLYIIQSFYFLFIDFIQKKEEEKNTCVRAKNIGFSARN